MYDSHPERPHCTLHIFTSITSLRKNCSMLSVDTHCAHAFYCHTYIANCQQCHYCGFPSEPLLAENINLMSPAPYFHQPSPGLTDPFNTYHNASSNVTTELHRNAGFHKPQVNKVTAAKLYEPCPVIQTLNQAGLHGPLVRSHSTSTISGPGPEQSILNYQQMMATLDATQTMVLA